MMNGQVNFDTRHSLIFDGGGRYYTSDAARSQAIWTNSLADIVSDPEKSKIGALIWRKVNGSDVPELLFQQHYEGSRLTNKHSLVLAPAPNNGDKIYEYLLFFLTAALGHDFERPSPAHWEVVNDIEVTWYNLYCTENKPPAIHHPFSPFTSFVFLAPHEVLNSRMVVEESSFNPTYLFKHRKIGPTYTYSPFSNRPAEFDNIRSTVEEIEAWEEEREIAYQTVDDIPESNWPDR